MGLYRRRWYQPRPPPWIPSLQQTGPVGALDVNIGAITLSAAGSVAITGQLSLVVDNVSLSAGGALSLSGSLAVGLGEITLSGTGVLSAGPAGVLDVQIPAMTLGATGALSLSAQLAQSIGELILAAFGSADGMQVFSRRMIRVAPRDNRVRVQAADRTVRRLAE